MGQQGSVTIDWEQGQALIGDRVVVVTSLDGAIQVGGETGVILRPLTFLERTRATVRSLYSNEPREVLSATVLQTSTLEKGKGEPEIQEILALWLAGAGQDAPSFVETELRVMRSLGWSCKQIGEMPALEVDRLALDLIPSESSDEWTSIVFAPPAKDLETIRGELADELLERASAPDLGELNLVGQALSISETLSETFNDALNDELSVQQNLSLINHRNDNAILRPHSLSLTSAIDQPQGMTSDQSIPSTSVKAQDPSLNELQVRGESPPANELQAIEESPSRTQSHDAVCISKLPAVSPKFIRGRFSEETDTAQLTEPTSTLSTNRSSLDLKAPNAPPSDSSQFQTPIVIASSQSQPRVRSRILPNPTSESLRSSSRSTPLEVHGTRSTDWQEIPISNASTSSISQLEGLNQFFTQPTSQRKTDPSQSLLINTSHDLADSHSSDAQLPDPIAFADALAELLHREADLRGLER